MQPALWRNAWRLALPIALAVWLGLAPDAHASKIYSYTDEHGNFVATDIPENVPPKYRGKVQVREVQDSGPSVPAPASSPRPAVGGSGPDVFFPVGSVVQALAERYPKVLMLPGTNGYQSLVFIVGALAAVLMMGGMYLCKDPSVRILMKFMLGFLVASAAYTMYVSELNSRAAAVSGQPVGSQKSILQQAQDAKKAQEDAQRQQKKVLDSLDGPSPAGPSGRPPGGRR
jgi:hypothetical protein